MNFVNHSNLEGQHAFLGASKYYWINYDEESLIDSYRNSFATQIGTSLHDLARGLIKNRIKVNKNDKHLVLYHLLDSGIPSNVIDVDQYFTNFAEYVNDAIGFKMTPEVILRYSDFCFGTTDTIGFRNDFLRIHDYKSGKAPAHIEQLIVYASLFCLEYKIKPSDIGIELRIYQNGEVFYDNPTVENILPVMDKIITFDKIIRGLRDQEG